MLIISLQLYVNLNRFIYICCLKGTLHDIYVSAFEIAQIKSSYLAYPTEVHDVNNAASSSCVHSALTLISRDCLDIKCQIVRCNQRLIGRMKYSNILVDPYQTELRLLISTFHFLLSCSNCFKTNRNISMKKRGLHRNLLSDIIFRLGIWLMLNVRIPVRIQLKRDDL